MKSRNDDYERCNMQRYGEYDSEPTLWDWLQEVAKAVCAKVIYWVLVVYYALQSPSLPMKDKAKIVAALAYLFLPVDLIPDIVPVVGIVDDVALLFAVFRLLVTIDDAIIERAKEKVRQWFGE